MKSILGCLLMVLQSTIPGPIRINGPATLNPGVVVTGPSNFAYVASSVTGCYDGGGGQYCVYALHTNPSAGNLIFCEVNWDKNFSLFAFSGSLSGAFTAIGSAKLNAAGTFETQNYWVKAAGGGTETITSEMNNSSSTYTSWECTVYSYSGTLTTLDGTPGYSNTAASGSVATLNGTTMGTNLVTTGSSDLVVASCGITSTACSSKSPYTSRNDTNACASNGLNVGCPSTGNGFNANDGGLIEDQVGVGAGTQTATFGTSGATDPFTGGLVAF